MKPVDQTQFKGLPPGENGKPDEVGNCFAACIASIFEFDLEDIPNFCAFVDWQKRVNVWLSKYDFCYLDVRPNADIAFSMLGYHVISGPSPRLPNCYHSVVGLKGKMVHDPHPSRDGLKTLDPKFLEYGVFIWKGNDLWPLMKGEA